MDPRYQFIIAAVIIAFGIILTIGIIIRIKAMFQRMNMELIDRIHEIMYPRSESLENNSSATSDIGERLEDTDRSEETTEQ